MPIYEYRCQGCQHELEIMQRISDAPLVRCPACGEDRLSKLISQAAFQLKGTGWYATDYKDSGKKAEPKAEPVVEAKSEQKSSKSSEKTETTSTPSTKTTEAA